MLSSPAWKEVYAPHGYLAVEGDWIRREKYAKTLEIIAEQGADAFYEGDLAQKMVRTIHGAGGVLQLDDVSARGRGRGLRSGRSALRVRLVDLHADAQFSKYKAHVYPAIKQRWGDKTIYTTTAPSS
jgi:gamma-glutamyltranspeptidase/glutathione hydrolase/leukotriene-C4 hydrolase